MTSAAAIMVAVFSVFATLSLLIEFKVFGVAMAAAVLIDATIVRGAAAARPGWPCSATGPSDPAGLRWGAPRGPALQVTPGASAQVASGTPE